MGIICLEPVVVEELWAKNQQTYSLIPAIPQTPYVKHHYENFEGRLPIKSYPFLFGLFSKASHT